jgi:hypothetical protein
MLLFIAGFVYVSILLGVNGKYKKLQNFNFFLIHFLISVILTILALIFISNGFFELKHGNPSIGLMFPLPFLLAFQLCRYIVKKVQNREFIVALNFAMDKEDLKIYKKIDILLTIFVLFHSVLIVVIIGLFLKK